MAGAGLRCCCTPPPNAKELGACCYTEEIFGILHPRCIPSLTEEECAGSTYPNATFSAGLACGDRVACAIDVLNPDGPKAIKKVFTPTSRFDSYTRDIRVTDLFPEGAVGDYRQNISTNYNPFPPGSEGNPRPSYSLSNKQLSRTGTNIYSDQCHQPVNYFFFVTNDNSLYLCITLDNEYQQFFTMGPNDPFDGFYKNLQTRIFKISSNFTIEDKQNITATDNWNNTPMLIWDEGKIDSIFNSVLYSAGPFWAAWAKEMRISTIFDGSIDVHDYFENVEFLKKYLIGEKKSSKISCKYGGRMTVITTLGNVVQGGSYNAGAAVAYLPVEGGTGSTDFETLGLRFIPRFRGEIETELDSQIARQRLESNDSNSALDIKGITGSRFDQQYRGGDNLQRVEYYNQARAELRDQKVKSIRGATKIEENFYATAVLTNYGGIYTWGDPKYGGDDYYNSVTRLQQGNSDRLILNSENQNTQSSRDYVEILPMGRGFLGFKTWDGVNNNVTLFGFFAMGLGSPSTQAFSDYETFLQNGKRYEPSDAILLNDGGVILKAFGEDNYTIVGGHQGYRAIQGNFSAPSSGLTIKKALCADQSGDYRATSSTLYLILWSDGTLQAISFSVDYYPNRENDPFGSMRINTFQRGWERWMDEETLGNRKRTFNGVRDIFLINQNYGFGYILENDDADGYNTVIILKRGARYDASAGQHEFWTSNSSGEITKLFLNGFNMNYQVARDTGADVQDIFTTAYKNIGNFGIPGIDVDTGFTKVRYKKIDYATSTVADPYSSYGPSIDCTQDHRKSQHFNFTSAFLYTKQNFNTDLADGENNIIGIHWRQKSYKSPFGDFDPRREPVTEDVFVKHTRVNPVDSQTEDAGSPLFNFDYINLFVNQKGQLLSSPGIQFKNDDYWSNAELFLTGEVDAEGQDSDLSINNVTTIETFENCADSICHICGGTNHKCNVETGECFDCVPAGSKGYNLPSCDEVPDIYPWSLILNGPCESNPCPSEFTAGCCCAYYQRTPEEPVWFLQQVVTIPRNELTGIDQYIQENGCFENSSFQYYDGSPIPSDQIEYTFTPFDDNFTELNCGAELFSNDFVQTCGEDLFDGSNTFVSVDNIDLREPCPDVNGNRTVDITFTKRVQGLRCKVNYSIPAINSLLQDIGCSPINNDSGTITFLENENEKTITLNLCCKLTGTFNVSYTVSPV